MADSTPSPNNVITTTGLLAQRPRPVGTSPRHSFDLNMALMSEDQMNAISEALREAKEKKPGIAKFVIGLVAPLGLAGKSALDLSKAFAVDASGKTYLVDSGGFALAIVGIVVGAAAAVAVLLQLVNDRKLSKLLLLAEKHADEWLGDLRGSRGGPA